MKEWIRVKDLAVGDIVKDMAKELKVEYSQNYNEFSLNLPENFGSGFVKAYEFENGIGIVLTNYIVKKDFHFQLEKGKVHPLKIVFNTGETFLHKFQGEDNYDEIHELNCAILSSTPSNNHIFMIPANKTSRIFTLEINRKLFENYASEHITELNDFQSSLFRDVNGVNVFKHIAPYSHAISNLIDQFVNCEFTGLARKVFLDGKSQEIFAEYLRQYSDDREEKPEPFILRQYTIKCVRQAAEIIESSLSEPPTVGQLAKSVGINSKLLQQGFRSVYRRSVNEFILSRKLDKAIELLTKTELTISQITYEIGISSKSYFSKLFKEHYGLSPSTYRQKFMSSSTSA